MAITSRILIALVALALMGGAAPAANAAEGDAELTLFFHDNSQMDETAEAKSPYDPSTLAFSWNDRSLVWKSDALAEATTIAAGNSINFHLYRDVRQDNNYTTDVKVTYRLGSDTVEIATGTFGPVAVEGVSAEAEHPDHAGAVAGAVAAYRVASGVALEEYGAVKESACNTFTAACDTAPVRALRTVERLVPGAGTLVGSFYDVIGRHYVDLVLDAAVDEPEQKPLEEDWGLLGLTLDTTVTVPAGAQIHVEVLTSYPNDPFEDAENDRFAPGELSRPDVITYLDRADTPTRVEFTLG